VRINHGEQLAMIEAFVVTIFPAIFLVILFGGGFLFKRQRIDMDGAAPINGTLFYTSKYSIIALWAAMVLQSWSISISLVKVIAPIRWISLFLWLIGFILLFLGRFGLGSSFRLGIPRESTRLRVDGLYRFSRNPMYLGVYATLLAAVLYTLNPIVLLLAVFVIAVHHKIVLAEEEHMREAFGQEYVDYSRHVRRYI
jgi:protein-S-isoprenylcysteine O-methyltransferase Ste14